MSLQTKYTILKSITIALGALSIPWGTFIGFCFGEGRYFIGLVALCAQTLVSLVDGYIWFWVLENMENRLELEKKEKQNRETSRSVVLKHGDRVGAEARTACDV